MQQDPHVQLMLKFKNGDEDAFKQLFEIFKAPILNFIYRFFQDKRIAEELSQEVFLRVYKTAATYRPEAKFSTWIYRIATNLSLNELRTGKYRHEVKADSENEIDAFAVADKNNFRSGSFDDKIIQQERYQLVKEAILELPEKQRMALLFSVYEQLPYKEIGERLKCSEAAVKSIIHRSKIAVKNILKRGFAGEK